MATARSTSIPAPTGGLNDRDNIADMPPQDALILDNWWPYPSYIEIRKGSLNHVTGFSNPVETLAEYLPPSGAAKMFAVSGGAIYDITTAGVVGAAMVSGLSNSQWQWQGITTPGGSFLYMVNGVDSPRLWNGTTWTAITGSSSPAITGVTTSTLAHVTLFKNRLFFVQNNTMNVWYLPVNSVGGAAALLDLGSVFRRGGRVEACYTWTLDAGNGSDDHFVIISSNGEIAVYRGTDPSSAADWGIVGVFVLGRPLGRRCGVKFGGDLAVNTTEGIFPLSRGLLSSDINRQGALTDKIQNATSAAAQSYFANSGWQVEVFPDENMLILNVPAGNGQNYQYAQNTISGAWTKFVGWDARCWLKSYDDLYFGASNAVVKAWAGNLDNNLGIVADVLPAFNHFGVKARNKFFTMVKPYILTTGAPSLTYSLNVDYYESNATGQLSYAAPNVMVWGSMTWGAMVWGGALSPIKSWKTVGAVANAAAIRLRALNNGSTVRLSSVDYLYQPGGVL